MASLSARLDRLDAALPRQDKLSCLSRRQTHCFSGCPQSATVGSINRWVSVEPAPRPTLISIYALSPHHDIITDDSEHIELSILAQYVDLFGTRYFYTLVVG